MRENDGLYEYIAVYVDDLLIATRDPGEITRVLEESHKFKLQGVGPLTYHLGRQGWDPVLWSKEIH
jgi:hypothetical protein